MNAAQIDFLADVKVFFEKGLGPAKDFAYEIVKCDSDGAIIDMPYNADFATSNEDKSMHGAVMTTLIDTCLGMAALTKSESTRPIATVDLRVDFLQPGAALNDVRCQCHSYHIRNDIAYAEGSITDKTNGNLLIKAMGTFMLGTKGPDFSQLKAKLGGV
jgi:uncharacterized protein (TIGR00369 family)